MKITSLVENISNCNLKPKHGLSLYIETQKHKILFDTGPDDTVFENAECLNIDLTQVDTVIISHGHDDHGGALKSFLEVNKKAKVYIQQRAFLPHFSKQPPLEINIGLDESLAAHPQIILTDGDHTIDEELSLFCVYDISQCRSEANDSLYENDAKDKFEHEQSLIINESKTVLIMGCGHTGIVNIMRKASAFAPEYCIGGYHLFNPATKKTVSEAPLSQIAEELQKYQDIKFYTCHCTGEEAFAYLSQRLPNMMYLQCGESISV